MIQEFFTTFSEVCNAFKVILGPEAVETWQLEVGAGGNRLRTTTIENEE